MFKVGDRVRYKWDGKLGKIVRPKGGSMYDGPPESGLWMVQWDANTPDLHPQWRFQPLEAHEDNLELISPAQVRT